MLSKSAMYGLRIMAVLSSMDGEEPLKASEIALRANIPTSYLSKILRRMVESNLLCALKGHRGGFTLAKSRKEISFQDVLESLQGKNEKPICVFGLSECSSKNPCILHHQWAAARAPFEKWACETTLADIAVLPNKVSAKNQSPKKKKI
jgi:Rrf2 family iron-sulfur cluster assembly transcriptional regulator